MKKNFQVVVLLILALSTAVVSSGEQVSLYAVADKAAPVLNTPDFGRVFGENGNGRLMVDSSGLIREVEFIALPGTVFNVQEKVWINGLLYYKVLTEDYPYPSSEGYYVDARFVSPFRRPLPVRMKKIPDRKTIIKRLIAAEGDIYIWGGNVRSGIPEMLSYYSPGRTISKLTRDKWMLKGLDCSGLLYQATGGSTPRNTSALINYGRGVSIAGASLDEILERLRPLDLIVWKGHVIIVLDHMRCIESRLDYDKTSPGSDGGVRTRPSRVVLRELLTARVPVDQYPSNGGKYFVVRRWISN